MCPGPAPARASMPTAGPLLPASCERVPAPMHGHRRVAERPCATAPYYQQQHEDRVADLASVRARAALHTRPPRVTSSSMVIAAQTWSTMTNEFKSMVHSRTAHAGTQDRTSLSQRASDSDSEGARYARRLGVSERKMQMRGTGCAFAIRDPRDDFGDSKEGDATMEYKQTAIYFGLPHRLCAASKSTLHRRS
ncbi:hypothetical protein DFH09DRAFT_1315284 [Mycena vulgaris]|nr:hypothetical protein DFH09DRAFT_1315284 [Mycena vulgaris]